MKQFTRKNFSNPPPELSPAYFWGINDRMDLRQLKSQLRAMKKNGVNSVCLHPFPPEWRPAKQPSRMSPPYLSKDYMKIIRSLVNECARLGMNYYFYDEGGYPSGGACGQVLASDPQKFGRLHAVSDGKNVEIHREAYDPTVAAPYPDLLAEGVTKKFIELTHERHKKAVGRYFGNTIRYVFTDEPAMTNWTDDLPQYFRKRKGYDLMPYLAKVVMEAENGEAAEITRARVDYQEIRSELYQKRFLLPIRKWCRANHLLFGGHLNIEHEPFGNIIGGHGNTLQALRSMNLPGVDAIWRQVFPGVESFSFAKCASSAAHQKGHSLALAELYAVYGNGITPCQMKWLADHMMVRGINLFVLSVFKQHSYHNWMSGCRPEFGPDDPLWKYKDLFHAYLARSGYLLSLGTPCSPVACYYDVRGIWAAGKRDCDAIRDLLKISEMLLEKHAGFDYIDDLQLSTAKFKDGKLRIGRAEYDTLILPHTEWMSEPAKNVVAQFRESGGKVLFPEDLDQVPPLLQFEPDHKALRVLKRTIGKKTLYFIVNEGASAIRTKITFPEKGNIVLCSPEDAELYQVDSENGTVTWSFEPYSSAFFMTGVRHGKIRETFAPTGHVLELKDGWIIQPLKRYYPGKHQYEQETLHAAPKPCRLGDWRQYLGEDFSGDVLYTADLDWSGASCEAWLELGDVKYCCSVCVNGGPYRKFFAGPFRLKVRLKKGKNHIRIKVTNTFANAFSPAEVEQYWQKDWPVSPYEAKQRKFERDCLDSGLFGPVKIYLDH